MTVLVNEIHRGKSDSYGLLYKGKTISQWGQRGGRERTSSTLMLKSQITIQLMDLFCFVFVFQWLLNTYTLYCLKRKDFNLLGNSLNLLGKSLAPRAETATVVVG